SEGGLYLSLTMIWRNVSFARTQLLRLIRFLHRFGSLQAGGVWGSALYRFRQHKVLAALLGMLATAGPALWFTSWLQRKGETEVSVTANWTIGRIDLQIGQAV